jgi:hypothetical protein
MPISGDLPKAGFLFMKHSSSNNPASNRLTPLRNTFVSSSPKPLRYGRASRARRGPPCLGRAVQQRRRLLQLHSGGTQSGRSYVTCQIKLSNAQVRFARWGEAVGICSDALHASQPRRDIATRDTDEAKVRDAQTRASHIIQLIDEAKEVSQKYKPQGDMAVSDPCTGDNRKALKLAEQVRNISFRRKAKNTLIQKASWALYRADDFSKLLSAIADEVKNLEELSPAVEAARKQLVKSEIEDLGTTSQLAWLKESATSEEVQDQLLVAALDRKLALAARGSTTTYSNSFGSGNKGFQSGHVSGGTFTFGQ